MAQNNDSTMATFLKEHPRMMGVLFTLVLLLSQAGMVVAENSSSHAGP